MKDDRVLGRYAWTLAWSALPSLGIYVTLTCLQALGIYPLARQEGRDQLLCDGFLAAEMKAQFHQLLLS